MVSKRHVYFMRRVSWGSMNQVRDPGDQVGLDFIGTVDGVQVLVMVDYLSRRKKLEACDVVDRNHKGIEGWLRIRGGIRQIVTDGDKAFDNTKVKYWLDRKGIDQVLTLLDDHRSSRLTERCNRMVWWSIRKCQFERIEVHWWDMLRLLKGM